MPRKRVGTVKESLEELQALEEHYRGKPEQVRVTVLRLLKEDPERGIEDVALLAGYSAPTVKRWWRAYREGGMDALVSLPSSIRPSTVDDELAILKQKLIAGEFNRVEDVHAWIEGRAQGHLKRNGSRLSTDQIIRNSGTRRSSIHRNGDGGELEPSREDHALTERILTFLSSIPSTHTVKEWTDAFRPALQALLGDVDRVLVSVNVRCDLLNPKSYQPDIVVSQIVHSGAKAVSPLVELGIENKNEDVHLQRILDNLRGGNFPFGNYHPPVCFVYYYMGHAFLGVIILWRERSRPPISERSLMLMERLTSFMGYILSDFAARHQAANPVEHVFDHALIGVTQETGLTMQERRIMVLQLLGLSYDEVATSLSISLNTVRYHLRSIYQKTGTHSLAELFAKYFTPRIDSNQPQE